jgi:hypothetical protein
MTVERFCTKGCDGTSCPHRDKSRGCVYEYDASKYEPQFRWKGEGDPPRRWNANGTIVYRTFADYCD